MTSQPSQPTPGGRLRVLSLMATAFLGGSIMLGIVGTLLADPAAEPSIGLIVAPAVVGLVAGVAAAFLRGSVLQPVPAGAPDAESLGASRFQSWFFLSVALAELPVLSAIVIVVALEGTLHVPVVGALASVALIVLSVWPSRERVRSAQQRLDASGARTRLEQQYAG